ncbi:MAG: carbamoylphosphate synthase large subunit [Eubacteriales bacterium]|nr:carbamoylphosphate synthase large subunit [Eubacteriales bacterium]
MNVIFISPGYPKHFYQFCDRLKTRGVHVLGIGDTPWECLSQECRNALNDYRSVQSLADYEAVYRCVAEFIFLYGRIDFVESQNEYWLELDARIRTDFHITSGPNLAELAAMNRKSEMKAAYARAGIPAARWLLPQNLEQALAFAKDVGYPIIIKPDHGMGASDTHKLKNGDDLISFWESRNAATAYIEEECVPGHVETFDGITDSSCNVLFAASQVLPKSLMDAAHGDDIISYCQDVPEDLRQAGTRLLKEFNTKNRFFHFEFFRLDADREGLGREGGIVGLEVNMRAPGGRIPDKMNYAFETDVYTIWADSLIYDRCFLEGTFRHYITHIGRRNAIAYVRSDAEIRSAFGDQIIEDFEVDETLAPDMGDHAFLLRADSRESWEYQIHYILERKA